MGTSQIPTEPFRHRYGLRGGHLQTIASFLLTRKIDLPPAEERLIEVDPGIRVLCDCNWQPERSQAMTLLMVHGLEGSSDSGYMLGTAHKALAAGMNVVRMNQRNCGGTDHLAPTLYNSGLSHDVGRVAQALVESEQLTRFALSGFSMGGNLVLKLAGEWGRNHPPQLKGVAVVCPAMDLAASADALHRTSNRLYEQHFLIKLCQRLRRKAELFPGQFDASRARGIGSLRDFDDRVTAYYCGFAGAADYYDRAAASRVVDRIAVPTFLLYAKDDPFVRILPESRAKVLANPNITFVETEHGGHCSFLAPADGYDGRWAERQVVAFVRQL